jgi:hypothetical protein
MNFREWLLNVPVPPWNRPDWNPAWSFAERNRTILEAYREFINEKEVKEPKVDWQQNGF